MRESIAAFEATSARWDESIKGWEAEHKALKDILDAVAVGLDSLETAGIEPRVVKISPEIQTRIKEATAWRAPGPIDTLWGIPLEVARGLPGPGVRVER